MNIRNNILSLKINKINQDNQNILSIISDIYILSGNIYHYVVVMPDIMHNRDIPHTGPHTTYQAICPIPATENFYFKKEAYQAHKNFNLKTRHTRRAYHDTAT